MNQPKYQIGDRFTVMETVQCKIIQIIGTKEVAYIFELFNNPVFKSVITEKELDKLLAIQPA
jgi:hypothetical protein